MKRPLDQGSPRRTAALLRQAGVDAVHTAEIGLSIADIEVPSWINIEGTPSRPLEVMPI